MAGAHQHAALARDQRKHVAGAHEIGGAAVAVGERAHGVAALLGRDAGGEAVAHVDRDGEGGAERRVVLRHHRIEMQALARLLGAERRADDAGGVADDERHLFRRAQRGGDEQVALVLAVVVVGDDDDLALGEGLDRRFDACCGYRARDLTSRRRHSARVVERPRRALAHLAAMHQIMIGQHACHHRLADRHRADADAGVVAALGDDLGVAAVAVDRPARRQDRRGRLDGKARDDRLPGRDAAENAAGMVGQKHRLAVIAHAHLVGIFLAASSPRWQSRRRSRRP